MSFGRSSQSCVPRDFEELDVLPSIYPDYSGTTFPPNIAPANFRIEEDAQRYVVCVSGANGASLCVSGQNVTFPEKGWRKLLEESRNCELGVDVFVKREGKWLKYKTIHNSVSDDPVDPWLAYRLIEPGYDYGHRIALAERNVENFHERMFVDNRCIPKSPCVNCHSFQDHKTDRFMFHFRFTSRPEYGGTVFVDGDDVKKIEGKVAALGTSCSYPSWRPAGDVVAFSTNHTRQQFHSLSSQKIEVFDGFSDLALLDPVKNELKTITDTNDEFETFPFWSPDGLFLYYCSVHITPKTPQTTDNERINEIGARLDEMRYNVYRMSYDESTRSFGEPELVVDAKTRGRSAVFPRISPDGKFLVYAEAESGTFPIWRPETELRIMNLETGEDRLWDEVNSEDSDSYHSWSSNGRWMIFSSRREDGQYTRLYFTHVNPDGTASKPFVLPQKDPEHNRRRLKSYNVPETIVEPIKIDLHKIVDVCGDKPEETKNL